MEGTIDLRSVKVQPSGRLEESEVGVGGLHFVWISLCLLPIFSMFIMSTDK